MRPDVTVFGRYTYLVTEVLWGAVALAVLRRTESTRKALRVSLVLYPFAYAWDRYSLAVGIFDIPLRTGIEIAGIPLEEHLFMFVVPSMVVGTSELLDELLAARPQPHRREPDDTPSRDQRRDAPGE